MAGYTAALAVHLTPTSSSWLNQVERFFALLTDKKIRRGIYRSVAALRADITCLSTDTMPIQNRSDGLSPPMTSLLPSNASANIMPRQTRPNVANLWFRTLVLDRSRLMRDLEDGSAPNVTERNHLCLRWRHLHRQAIERALRRPDRIDGDPRVSSCRRQIIVP